MIPNLTPTDATANPETHRVSYEPAVLTVAGVSSYNPNEQISFREVDGFWKLPQSLIQAMRVPPIGVLVIAQLTTKPKPPGPNTKPGSLYMDIDKMSPAPKGSVPIAAAQQTRPHATAADWPQQPAETATREDWTPEPQQAIEVPLNVRIAKSQAWNGLTAMLAAVISAPVANGETGSAWFPDDDLQRMWKDWHDGFDLLRAGRVPFSEPEPARPEPEHESGSAPAEADEWTPTPAGDGYSQGEKIEW